MLIANVTLAGESTSLGACLWGDIVLSFLPVLYFSASWQPCLELLTSPHPPSQWTNTSETMSLNRSFIVCVRCAGQNSKKICKRLETSPEQKSDMCELGLGRDLNTNLKPG